MTTSHDPNNETHSFTIEPTSEVKSVEKDIISALTNSGILLARKGDGFQKIYLADGAIYLAREVVLDKYRVYLDGFNMTAANIEAVWNDWLISPSDPLILECSFGSKMDMDRFKRAVAR